MADGGVWRTVSGRRIFIAEGQDIKTAMRDSGKFGKGGTKEKNSGKGDTNKAKGGAKEIDNRIREINDNYNKEVGKMQKEYQAERKKLDAEVDNLYKTGDFKDKKKYQAVQDKIIAFENKAKETRISLSNKRQAELEKQFKLKEDLYK